MKLPKFLKNKNPNTINFSYKEFLKDENTTMNDDIREQHLTQLEKVKGTGKLLAQRSPSEPFAKSTINGVENETRSFYQRFIHSVRNMCSNTLSELEKQCNTCIFR